MLDTTAEPKSGKQAAHEGFMLLFLSALIPSVLGFLIVGTGGFLFGLYVGCIVGFCLAYIRKKLFIERLHNRHKRRLGKF